MHAQKWVSNSDRVVAALLEEDQVREVKVKDNLACSGIALMTLFVVPAKSATVTV